MYLFAFCYFKILAEHGKVELQSTFGENNEGKHFLLLYRSLSKPALGGKPFLYNFEVAAPLKTSLVSLMMRASTASLLSVKQTHSTTRFSL